MQGKGHRIPARGSEECSGATRIHAFEEVITGAKSPVKVSEKGEFAQNYRAVFLLHRE
jgi:hypothetical protein